jgi:hypothetical protein
MNTLLLSRPVLNPHLAIHSVVMHRDCDREAVAARTHMCTGPQLSGLQLEGSQFLSWLERQRKSTAARLPPVGRPGRLGTLGETDNGQQLTRMLFTTAPCTASQPHGNSSDLIDEKFLVEIPSLLSIAP